MPDLGCFQQRLKARNVSAAKGSEGQTAVARAAQLTGGEEAITADQQAEILACLTLAAQVTETTIKGLREGEIPFKAIRYEAMPADPDE